MTIGLFVLEVAVLIIQVLILIGLIIMFVSGSVSAFHGVPYVPMRKKFVRDLLAFGGLSSSDIFYDLGSGDGRVLLSAVKDFHVQKATGYEVAPWPYWKSRWRVRQSGLSNIEIRRQNLFSGNYTDATFIYGYLFPKLVDRLATKFAGELRPGTKILYPDFPINLDVHPEFELLKSEKIGRISAYLYEKK